MKILDRTTIASGGWISLQKVRYLGHDGKIRTWESACRINSRGAVMMIPVTRPGDKLIIIRQFRPPTGRLVYEFPAGLINPGEDPRETAVRELKEETGLDILRIDEWWGQCYSAIGFSNERNACCVGVAGGSFSESTSTQEEITPGWYTKEQVKELLATEAFAVRTQAYCYMWVKN